MFVNFPFQVLHLAGNKLTRLNGDEAFKTQRIETLGLHGNRLAHIDRLVVDILPALQTLHVENNALEDVPELLTSAAKLTTITMGGNPFRCDCSDRFRTQQWLPENLHRVSDANEVYCVENLTRALRENDTTVLSAFPPNADGDLFMMPMMDFVREANR